MKFVFALSIGFQNGMSWPQFTKTHKLIRVLGNGPFPDQGPGGGAHGAGSPTQQYDIFAKQTLKYSVYFMQRIKSYSIFAARQTDAHFASLYARARFFSIWQFIPFTTLRLFVCFAHSLTLFVKDKKIFLKKPWSRIVIGTSCVLQFLSRVTGTFNHSIKSQGSLGTSFSTLTCSQLV